MSCFGCGGCVCCCVCCCTAWTTCALVGARSGCTASSVGGFVGGAAAVVAALPPEVAHPPFMSCKQPPHINQLHFTSRDEARQNASPPLPPPPLPPAALKSLPQRFDHCFVNPFSDIRSNDSEICAFIIKIRQISKNIACTKTYSTFTT